MDCFTCGQFFSISWYSTSEIGIWVDYYNERSFLWVWYVKGKREWNGYLIKENVLMRWIQFENDNVVNTQLFEPVKNLMLWIQANFEGLIFNDIPYGIGDIWRREPLIAVKTVVDDLFL